MVSLIWHKVLHHPNDTLTKQIWVLVFDVSFPGFFDISWATELDKPLLRGYNLIAFFFGKESILTFTLGGWDRVGTALPWGLKNCPNVRDQSTKAWVKIGGFVGSQRIHGTFVYLPTLKFIVN